MNLRAISINSANISCNIPSIITALSRSGASRLERLSLLGMSVGDKRAADLISALNCMPGLHNQGLIWGATRFKGRDGLH